MDLTPLIDVVFILLIFFIVASEFKKNETILNLSLPNSATKEKIVQKKALMIELSKDKLAYKASELNFDELKDKLSILKKDRSLTVKIDKEVKYERITKLLEILNTLGLSNLLLVTKVSE
jgi:biopolymer transport protein ExbD